MLTADGKDQNDYCCCLISEFMIRRLYKYVNMNNAVYGSIVGTKKKIIPMKVLFLQLITNKL